MKHDEVVAALKIIADTGIVAGISKDNVEGLKQYNLIVEEKGNKENKYTSYELTKKGRVMLKANSKPEPLP